MNRRVGLLLGPTGALLFCLLMVLSLAQAQQGDRITVVIFDFKGVGEADEAFGKTIAEILWRAIMNTYYQMIITIDRAEIAEVLKNAGISEPIEDPAIAAHIARSLGAERAIIGTFEKLGPSYRIDASLIGCSTAEVISIRRVKTADRGTEVISAIYELASKLVKDIQGEPVEELLGDNRDVLVNSKPEFKTSIWTDRGEGATYRIGDSLVVHFKTSKECYLTIFDIGTSGNIVIIFPNDYSEGKWILADREYTFPDKDDPFFYIILGPPGKECLKAICTLQDIELTAEDYINKTGIFSEVTTSYEGMSKDVAIVLSEGEEEVKWAEDGTCFIVKE